MGEAKKDESGLSALLCCPFCGNEAELDTMRGYRLMDTGRIGNQVSIYCNNCPCDISICQEDAPEATTEQLVEELSEIWNRRTA